MLFFIRVSKFRLNVARSRSWHKTAGLGSHANIYLQKFSGLANYINQFQSRDHMPWQIASWVTTRENERKR